MRISFKNSDQPAVIQDTETILRVIGDENLAQEWELVLLAQGLSPRILRTPEGIVLTVPREEVNRALTGLAAYEKENPRKAKPQERPVDSVSLITGTLVGLLLLAFFAITTLWNPAIPWFERGSANAGRIVDGEIWRIVTALTLHGDAVHALSNAFAIAVFLGAVTGQLGLGVGGALILLAGAGGNFANAIIRGSPYVSMGASTAIFGAVGILGSLAMIRRFREPGSRRRAWVAIAAALALLGMLGAGGGRIDVLAHFLGFLTGTALGMLIGFIFARRAGIAIQWTCGGVAVLSIAYCWAVALG